MKATSWSGSESSRREQGICRPPAHKPDKTPRFIVQAGTPCSIRPVTDPTWQGYRTRKTVGFDRYESLCDGCYVFRLDGYLMLIGKEKVQCNTAEPRFPRSRGKRR